MNQNHYDKFPQTGDRFHSVCFIQPVFNVWPEGGKWVFDERRQKAKREYRIPIAHQSWPFSVRTETRVGRFLRLYCRVWETVTQRLHLIQALSGRYTFHFFGYSTFRSAAGSIIFLERKLFPKGSAWDEDPVSFEGYQTTLESPLAYAAAEALRKF